MIARNKHAEARPRFSLGQIVGTPDALQALEESGESPDIFLRRHAIGDWGDIDEHDRRENELALREGFRLMSVYPTKKGTTIWVLTEADRSSSCILLPENY